MGGWVVVLLSHPAQDQPSVCCGWTSTWYCTTGHQAEPATAATRGASSLSSCQLDNTEEEPLTDSQQDRASQDTGELEDWLSSHMLSTGCLGVRLVYSQYSKSGILIRGGLRHQPALTHITSHQHTGTASYTRHNLTLHNTITNNTITNNTISNSKNNIT